VSSVRESAYVWLVTQLRAARLRHGWSQKELASKLGKPQSYVSKYETGERRLDFIETIRVARVLGLDLTQLVPPGLD
jgi:transcriptional regulator with XRE-family HTH domain